MKVHATRYGVIHGLGSCDDCDFTDGLKLSESDPVRKLKARIKKHVKDTGHTASLETGFAWKFEPIERYSI